MHWSQVWRRVFCNLAHRVMLWNTVHCSQGGYSKHLNVVFVIEKSDNLPNHSNQRASR